jgi:hypothetical protein
MGIRKQKRKSMAKQRGVRLASMSLRTVADLFAIWREAFDKEKEPGADRRKEATERAAAIAERAHWDAVQGSSEPHGARWFSG